MRRFALLFVVCLTAASLNAATATWTGTTSGLWSVGTNWASGFAPSAGDDLVFPATGANQTNSNDLAAGTAFNSITFSGGNYNLSGNAITLGAGGLTFASTNFALISIPITLGASQAWAIEANGFDVIPSGALDLNGMNLTLNYDQSFPSFFGSLISGAGSITIAGSAFGGPSFTAANTTTAPLSSNNHVVEVAGTYLGPITLSGIAELIVENGGTVGNVNVGLHSSFLSGPNSGGTGNVGNLTFAASTGSDFSEMVATISGTGPGQFSQANVTGSVALNSAILVMPTPVALPVGSAFTMINNDGTDPISGTFNGQPEGTLFVSAPSVPQIFKVSYAGGDGNDVVFTAEGTTLTTTTTVSTSQTPALPGTVLTFTAAVTSPQGIPTGLVEFDNNGVAMGTSLLDATGHATLSTAIFGVGAHSITAKYLGLGFPPIGGSTSAPVTETITTVIPALDWRALLLLVVALAVVGAVMLSASEP